MREAMSLKKKGGALGGGLMAAAGLLAAGAALAPRPADGIRTTLYWSTDCPVGLRTAPRMAEMIEAYSAKGVAFEIVFPNEMEIRSEVRAYLSSRGLKAPFRLDIGGEQARADGIERIPSAVVRDASGGVLYRGAIDDNKIAELVKKPYLKDALDAALAGRKPEIGTAEAFGCLLMAGRPAPRMEDVNYSEHVADILDRRCVECHRPGEVAPFSLQGYESARKWSRMIDLVSQQGLMPPWPAAPGIGEFHDENRLSELEKETLRRWSEAGAPQGDPAKAPARRTFPVGWTLGQPDIELSMPEPFRLGPEGADEYWNFVLDPGNSETVYVQGIDVRPGNKKIVHHVIAFIDEQGRGDELLKRPGARSGGYLTSGGGVGFNPDGSLGGWAPGVRARRLDAGAAFVLKPGTKLILQVHYHKTGQEETDQTRIGLYTTPAAPEHPVGIAWMANPLIRIAPGAADARFKQTLPIPRDLLVFSVMPHMHLLGKEMKATLIHPDGTREPMIHVPRWDFNWQMVYYLREPKLVQAGSKIEIEAAFDNSADNPNNPHNPPKLVGWGEETTDEMMLLVVMYSRVRS
jgi:hypothetical protein